jgi:outer membrane protein assembly factor BamB
VIRRTNALTLGVLVALACPGCGRSSLLETTDPGAGVGSSPRDSGTKPGVDSGTTPAHDGGTNPGHDGGTNPGHDGGTSPGNDGGTSPGNDGGAAPPDLGFPTIGPTDAPTFRIDAAHTGAQPLDTLTPPLSVVWTVDVGARVSYPLVANGTVFITAGGWNLSLAPGSVTAVDRTTGATLWGPLTLGNEPLAAYDRGSLFVINFDGQLISLDAATGATNWSVNISRPYRLSSPPVAVDGVVYVPEAGGAFAEADGHPLWRAPYYGTDGAVAVHAGIVFTGESDGQSSAIDASTGRVLWHHSTGESGGGGSTPTIVDEHLYVRYFPFHWESDDEILDPATGALLGTFHSLQPPAFSEGIAYYLDEAGTLSAVPTTTGAPAWTFVGDGSLTTAPMVGGSFVFVGSSMGNLWALDTSGNVVWTTTVGGGINAYEEIASMVVAEGTLFVPVGQTLVAFR